MCRKPALFRTTQAFDIFEFFQTQAGVAIVKPIDQGAEMLRLMVGEDQIRNPHDRPRRVTKGDSSSGH
jgi:hypothetical protein